MTQPEESLNQGLMALRDRYPTAALPHLLAAVQTCPGNPQSWGNYLEALIQANDLGTARHLLEVVHRHQISNPHVQKQIHRLEQLEHIQNRFFSTQVVDMERQLQQLLQEYPDLAPAYVLLGVLYLGADQPQRALTVLQQGLELARDNPVLLLQLGHAQARLQNRPAAIRAYEDLLRLKPDHPEALLALGNLYADTLQYSPALARYEQVLALDPDNLPARLALGDLYYKSMQFHKALVCYQQVCTRQPDLVPALNRLGMILQFFNRTEEGIECFKKALELAPDDVGGYSGYLMVTLYRPRDHETTGKVAKRFGTLVTQAAGTIHPPQIVPYPPQPLRIGFVSADLRSHPVGYFLESLLSHLDNNRFTLIAYPTVNKRDAMSERLMGLFSHWHPIGLLNDAQACERIRQDGVHILLDLSGHTDNHRLPLFAWRPAPVQVTWLGYSGTTGVPQMDYILGDPWVTPLTEAAQYTEKIWQLPESYLCFDTRHAALPVNPLPALSNGYLTFGSLNNIPKMNDAVVSLWARILHALPTARLYLKTKALGDASIQALTRQRFAAHGIAPERLTLEGFKLPRSHHLSAYHQIDIALDPFPYNGTTTTVEALWMGVPVLSMKGQRFISHVGESILTNAGLSDWIATDPDDYLHRAVKFASDPTALSRLREQLRDKLRHTPVFDAPRFALHFQQALEQMWRAAMPSDNPLC